jgi:hypothetical protein
MEMWNAEKVAFPESTTYMDQLLKRLSAPNAEPVKSDLQAKEPSA